MTETDFKRGFEMACRLALSTVELVIREARESGMSRDNFVLLLRLRIKNIHPGQHFPQVDAEIDPK